MELRLYSTLLSIIHTVLCQGSRPNLWLCPRPPHIPLLTPLTRLIPLRPLQSILPAAATPRRTMRYAVCAGIASKLRGGAQVCRIRKHPARARRCNLPSCRITSPSPCAPPRELPWPRRCIRSRRATGWPYRCLRSSSGCHRAVASMLCRRPPRLRNSSHGARSRA